MGRRRGWLRPSLVVVALLAVAAAVVDPSPQRAPARPARTRGAEPAAGSPARLRRGGGAPLPPVIRALRLRGGSDKQTAVSVMEMADDRHQALPRPERGGGREGADFGGALGGGGQGAIDQWLREGAVAQQKQDIDFRMDDWYKDPDLLQEDEDGTVIEAGLSYEEWLAKHQAAEEQLRIERNETHIETEYGRGILVGEYGPEAGLGFNNYKPLRPGWQATVHAMPQKQLDRHLVFAAAEGDASLVRELVALGGAIAARNDQCYLPATIRFGLAAEGSAADRNESQRATYGWFDAVAGEACVCVYNWTLAHWAACNNHKDVLSEIARHGAPLGELDEAGLTPMHVAAGQGHADAVELLIQLGANVSAVDSVGNAPLHFACWEGREDVALVLLKGGASANQGNDDMYTPMHWAARRGQAEILRMLLAYGGDTDIEVRNDWIGPLTMAEDEGHEEACEVLAAHMGLSRVTPEEMNSYERMKLEEEARNKIKEMQEELVRRTDPSRAGEPPTRMVERDGITMNEEASMMVDTHTHAHPPGEGADGEARRPPPEEEVAEAMRRAHSKYAKLDSAVLSERIEQEEEILRRIEAVEEKWKKEHGGFERRIGDNGAGVQGMGE